MTTEPGRTQRLTPIERIIDRTANALSWVWLALIGVIGIAVVLRFLFGIGRIELEELQWHLYAIGFLAGIFGCTVHDRHVRVDVLRERFAPRTRDWIDLYGILLFQLPFIVLMIWSALPMVAESFATGERSASAGGLPFRWILKAVLPISFTLLGMATLAQLLRVGRRLFGEPAQPASAMQATGSGERP